MVPFYLFWLFIGILGTLCVALMLTVYRLANRLTDLRRRQEHGFQTLRYETIAGVRPLESQRYNSLPGTEIVVYDGRAGIGENDFTGNGGRAWDYVGHRFIENGGGEGSYEVKGNVFAIHRSNAKGRYELYLKRFHFNGRSYENLPVSETQQIRNLRLTFDVKRGTASHLLRFVFKGETTKEVLDEKDCVVFNPDWQKEVLFFSIAANENSIFRIDDLLQMEAPDKVQIRNFVLYEKSVAAPAG